MSRHMKIRPKIKVFVEGDTEENYISELKKCSDCSFTIKPVNMNGGGYQNFLNKLKKDSSTGHSAVFIIIDLDKAESEKDELKKLIKFCRDKNKYSDIPYFLIGTNKDFEYFSCCHCPSYKSNNTDRYITKELGYKSVDECKADKNIYNKLNKGKKNYKVALQKVANGKNSMKYFNYEYKKPTRVGKLIKVKKFMTNDEALNYLHTNMYDFFDLIGLI